MSGWARFFGQDDEPRRLTLREELAARFLGDMLGAPPPRSASGRVLAPPSARELCARAFDIADAFLALPAEVEAVS